MSESPLVSNGDHKLQNKLCVGFATVFRSLFWIFAIAVLYFFNVLTKVRNELNLSKTTLNNRKRPKTI